MFAEIKLSKSFLICSQIWDNRAQLKQCQGLLSMLSGIDERANKF